MPPAVSTRESSTPTLAAVAFFFVMASYFIVRPVRDQLGGALGSAPLPYLYMATLVAMLLLTPLFGMLVSRFPRARLLGWSYSFFALGMLLFVPAFVAQDRIGALRLGLAFYVWVSVFNLFVVSLFWSFMADVFNSVDARLFFPFIALGGTAGTICGSLITRILVQLIGVAACLLFPPAHW